MSPSLRTCTCTVRPDGISRRTLTLPLTMSETWVGRSPLSDREVQKPCLRTFIARASSRRCGGWSALRTGDEATSFMRLDSSSGIVFPPSHRRCHSLSVARRALARSLARW